MSTANFNSVKKSFLELNDAEQRRIVNAWLWRVTNARGSAINTQLYYNLSRELNIVCNNAGARDNSNPLVGFGQYKNVYLTQDQYDKLVASHTQDIVVDAVNQLSAKLNAGEYQTNDFLRSLRDFIKTEKLFREKHGVKKPQEFMRHNYSDEALRDVETKIEENWDIDETESAPEPVTEEKPHSEIMDDLIALGEYQKEYVDLGGGVMVAVSGGADD